MTADNNGGRVSFDQTLDYRILLTDGSVSHELYVMETEKSDRKGHVLVRQKDTTRQIKVQHRRVLPANANGKSCVIEFGGKYRSICPKCTYIEMITNQNNLTCPIHGQFDLHWIGVRPMSIETADTEKKEKKPSPEKKVKPAIEPKVRHNTVDIDAVAKVHNCELYVKNVNFDHEKFDVKSYVLIYVHQAPRKYCFNTYNGLLGKKSEGIKLDDFINNQLPQGSKQKPWYAVQDLDKMRDKLLRDGYVRHGG